jgi:S1-C subfamily serine protease
VRALGAELTTLSIADARDRGLSDEAIRALLLHDPGRRRVLAVQRVGGEAPAGDVLRATDLLLAIDGQPVTRMRDIEAALVRKQIDLRILRDGQEQTVSLTTQPVDGKGVDRVASWAGMVLHEPHREVAAQRGVEASGVYIAWLWYGSPAARYGLRPTRRIILVDDIPTPDLDALLEAVKGRADRSAVRLTMEALDGSIRVTTLKLDLHYWPTQVFEPVDGVWSRTTLGTPAEAVPTP